MESTTTYRFFRKMSEHNSKRPKQKKLPQEGPKNRYFSIVDYLKIDELSDYILVSLFFIYFALYLLKLYSTLGMTFFWLDENVHAYISSVILNTGSIPAELPNEIYGGFEYSYPPLFHIIGALVMSIAGFPALKFINLILMGFFIFGFFLLIRNFYGIYEALTACLLISLSPTVVMNSIRYMTEMLSMVLVFLSFFFLVIAIKRANNLYAIISGLSTGLLLLSKQIGIVVIGFYFLLLIWFSFKHKEDLRRTLLVIGTAACTYLPYLIWAAFNKIEVFGFLSVFFGTTAEAEWAAAAVKSFRKYDSSFIEFAYRFYKGNGLAICISFLVPLYQFVKTRAKDRPQNYIFIMLVYLAAVMIIWHISNPRHTITLLPLLAFLFGYGLQQVITNKSVIRALTFFLLILAAYSAFQMPNYRRTVNAPKDFLELAEIIKNDKASKGKILGVYAFNTVMYAHKPTIWAYPNLHTIPIDLFENQTPSDLYELLKSYKIEFILIDFHMVQSDTFVGRNYPIPFVRNCEALTRTGKLSLQALSKSKQFMLLKVS